MKNEFFWSDLFLKFWAFAANTPGKCISFAIVFLVFVTILYSFILTCANKKPKTCTLFLLTVMPGIFLFSGMLAPEYLPSVIKISPNTPYKEELQEELRQKAMTVGDTVWVIKRDESGAPTSIDEHIIFAKKSDSVLVDDALTIDGVYGGNDGSSTVLGSYPISDCYSDKEDAYAAVEAELHEK